MSGTRSSMRSCAILRIIGGYDQCDEGIKFKTQVQGEVSSFALPAYFYEMSEEGKGKADACCWNHTAVADWLEKIGKAHN